MATYQEQIAQWRAQRQQQETINRVEQVRAEHAEAEHIRDVEIANGNMEEAEYQDNVCMDLEKEFSRLCPPSPYSQSDINFLRKSRRSSKSTGRPDSTQLHSLTDAQ